LASASNEKSLNKSKYHHGDLHRALIDAALHLIANQGIEALTLREVAQQVGVSRMAPYRHFADKSALLAAVAEEGFRILKQQLDQTAQTQTDPLEKLQAIGVTYVRYAVNHAAHYRVMFGTKIADKQSYPALLQVARDTFDVLVQTLVQCQQSGLARSANPTQQAQIAWSLVHGLSMLAIDGQLAATGCSSPEELATVATQSLVEGLKLPG
jgi:AcrR family transcriptional regulator